jgi:hypothetical protein
MDAGLFTCGDNLFQLVIFIKAKGDRDLVQVILRQDFLDIRSGPDNRNIVIILPLRRGVVQEIGRAS